MNAHTNGYIYALERPSEPLPVIVSQLQEQAGWLPAAQSWWFGWSALEIRLPGLLSSVAELPTNWAVLHLFSPRLELRWLRRAQRHQALLLTERQLPLTGQEWLRDWHAVGVYTVEPARRLLVGEQWRVGEQTVRGSLQFPRQLDYQLPGESEFDASQRHSLRANVLEYYDAEYRLVTVRYANIYPQGNATNQHPTPIEEGQHG